MPHPASFSSLIDSLPKASLGLPRLAFRGIAETHHDGDLLLLDSLVMVALAAASFALLRRLRRLEGSVR